MAVAVAAPAGITGAWRECMRPHGDGLLAHAHGVVAPFRPLPLTRRNVFHRDGHRCQYCGISSERLSIDHILPRSRGGPHSWDNVTTACLRCNVHKGNRTPREAGMLLARQPRRPLSGPLFEAQRQMASGGHHEWAKYVDGWEGEAGDAAALVA